MATGVTATGATAELSNSPKVLCFMAKNGSKLEEIKLAFPDSLLSL